MSDLAIAAIAGASGVVVVAIVCSILGLKIYSVTSALADARVDAAQKAGLIAIAASNVAIETARADLAERKLRDLDALFNHASSVGPVDGAFDRLLQAYAAARPNTDASVIASSVTVPDVAPARKTGSSDLLKPGD